MKRRDYEYCLEEAAQALATVTSREERVAFLEWLAGRRNTSKAQSAYAENWARLALLYVMLEKTLADCRGGNVTLLVNTLRALAGTQGDAHKALAWTGPSDLTELDAILDAIRKGP